MVSCCDELSSDLKFRTCAQDIIKVYPIVVFCFVMSIDNIIYFMMVACRSILRALECLLFMIDFRASRVICTL